MAEPDSQISFVAEVVAPEDAQCLDEPIQFRLHANGTGFGEVVTLDIVLKSERRLSTIMESESEQKLPVVEIQEKKPAVVEQFLI